MEEAGGDRLKRLVNVYLLSKEERCTRKEEDVSKNKEELVFIEERKAK